jgi:membrane protein implicated in regulation of membrane protease activity
MLVQHFDHLPCNEYAFFFTISCLMLIVLQLLAKHLQKSKTSKNYQSNTHLLLGKTVEVTQVISDDTGYAKLDGQLWQVKLQHKNQKLQLGMQAIVVGVKGCHLQINQTT